MPESKTDVQRYQDRADAAGQKIRGYLIGMNTAAIGASLSCASLINEPLWAIPPCCLFITSLFVTGDCLFMSKDKAIRLRDIAAAEEAGEEPPELQDRELGPVMRRFYRILARAAFVQLDDLNEKVAVGSTPTVSYSHTTYDLIAFRLFVLGVVVAVVLFMFMGGSEPANIVPITGAADHG